MFCESEVIENELKYVLQKDFDQASLQGWTRLELRIAHFENTLPGDGIDKFRIRDEGQEVECNGIKSKFLKTYKKPMGGGVVKEINEPLTQEEFDRLFSESEETYEKIRYEKKLDAGEKCAVDFFPNNNGSIYFVMAEIEMPEGREEPQIIPEEIKDLILYEVTRDEITDFSSRKLSNPNYAKQVLRQIEMSL